MMAIIFSVGPRKPRSRLNPLTHPVDPVRQDPGNLQTPVGFPQKLFELVGVLNGHFVP
jgi:hypothetical protein